MTCGGPWRHPANGTPENPPESSGAGSRGTVVWGIPLDKTHRELPLK